MQARAVIHTRYAVNRSAGAFACGRKDFLSCVDFGAERQHQPTVIVTYRAAAGEKADRVTRVIHKYTR